MWNPLAGWLSAALFLTGRFGKEKPVITLIEALNYRCLRYVHRPLGNFRVLVGPNASGKTTFLDVVAILGRLVVDGLEDALAERSRNFRDLLWRHEGNRFELAVEARLPDELRPTLGRPEHDTIRYEVAFAINPESQEIEIAAESGILKTSEHDPRRPVQERLIFPDMIERPHTIISGRSDKRSQLVFKKTPGGNDNYYSEVYESSGEGWVPAFRLGPRKSTLANLPEDETRFPASTWLKGLLIDGVRQYVLNSRLMRNPSPPYLQRELRPDGSNLPWVVADLERRTPERHRAWVGHVRSALPDLTNVTTVEREEDRHRYLVLEYDGGLRIPSWMASDGTLRLLALTIPAYIPHFSGIFLIEEPENGIHPRAVETMFQSLSSVYDAQILLATHSPVILSVTQPADVLCFARSQDGATDIVSGDQHPSLRDWKGETNLGTLFAAGVLG